MNTLQKVITQTTGTPEQLAQTETYIPTISSLLKNKNHTSSAMTLLALANFRPDIFKQMLDNAKLDMIINETTKGE